MTNVDVCVCTFRRDSIEQTLRSLAALEGPADVSLRVIVVDNDETDRARARVANSAQALGLNYLYIHAPARNISIARNAALDHVTAPLAAFIDDDEVATPFWLAGLIAHHQESGAEVVFGPVEAIYGAGPAWLQAADLHSIRPVWRANGSIDTGYTCNVLLDRAGMTQAMRSVRFDPELGRSGGEDTFFFNQLHALGAKLEFAPDAVVREDVPSHRARMTWLLKRSFRSGQTHGRVLLAAGAPRPRAAALAGAKAIYCTFAVVATAPLTVRWRRFAIRAALHAGVVARLSGMADLQLY